MCYIRIYLDNYQSKVWQKDGARFLTANSGQVARLNAGISCVRDCFKQLAAPPVERVLWTS
jgi:hypothetical protein